MNQSEQLFPRPRRRMKQPTKAVLRDNLALMATELLRLRAIVRDVAALTQDGTILPTQEPRP